MQTFPGRVFAKLGEDNGFNWAVIIAWNFLQSLFPIILVMLAVLGVALGAIGIDSSSVEATVVSIIPANAHSEVMGALGTFHRQSGVFFLVGFAGLLWGGSLLFRAMEQAFAVIYHTRQRSMVSSILISFLMILVFTLLAGVMLVTSLLLGLLDRLPFLPTMLHNGIIAFGIQFLVGALAGFALFLAIYFFIPNRKMSWGKVWIGALVAGVLFEGLTLLFPLYIRLTGAGSAYGKTFGLLFLLMAFFYFLGLVTMVGVEVNSLVFAVPVDQPEGKASLQTPIQGTPTSASTNPTDEQVRREARVEPGNPANRRRSDGEDRNRRPRPEPAPAVAQGPTAPAAARRPSPIKAALGLGVLLATGALRRRGGTRRIA